VGREPGPALEDEAIDFWVNPRRGPPSPAIVWRSLFREDFLCVLRRGHPALRRRGRLTLERFVELPQILVAPGGRPGSLLDDALARHGLRRRVALRVPNFLVAPLVVVQSDLIVTLPARLARRVAASFPLELRQPPIDLPSFEVQMAWHERFRPDAGHAWFRRVLAEVTTTL